MGESPHRAIIVTRPRSLPLSRRAPPQTPCSTGASQSSSVPRLRGLLQEEGGERFPDDVAPADDHDVPPVRIVPAAREEFDDAGRRGGREPRATDQHETNVDRMETVHILERAHRGDGLVYRNLVGQRLLDQNAVDLRIAVQSADLLEESSLRHIRGEVNRPMGHPHFLGGLAFHLHVELRRRILPDENGREAWDHPRIREPREPRLQLGPNVVADLLAIDHVAGQTRHLVAGIGPLDIAFERVMCVVSDGHAPATESYSDVVRQRTPPPRSTKTLKTARDVRRPGCTLATGLASSRNVSARSFRSLWRTKCTATGTRRSRSSRPRWASRRRRSRSTCSRSRRPRC